MDITIINRGFTLIKSKIRQSELEAIKKHKLDVSELQWNYLVWVTENKDMKMSDLAKTLGVQKGTLSNNIKQLEGKKLIIKKPKGRMLVIETTQKGEKYIKLHHIVHAEIRKELEKVLSVNEIESLISIGNKVITQL